MVDESDDSPIKGATVKATQSDGKLVGQTRTERNGSYKIVGLPIGATLSVIYTKDPTYSPDQHEIVVSAAQDGHILLLHGDHSYYERTAAKIRAKVDLVPAPKQQQAWESEWRAIEGSRIRPAAKGWIAQGLQSSAPEALRESSLFSAYASADTNTLQLLEHVGSSGRPAVANNVSPLIINNIMTTEKHI